MATVKQNKTKPVKQLQSTSKRVSVSTICLGENSKPGFFLILYVLVNIIADHFDHFVEDLYTVFDIRVLSEKVCAGYLLC